MDLSKALDTTWYGLPTATLYVYDFSIKTYYKFPIVT